MALSDRNIVITPNKGKSADPSIAFSGANATVGAQTIYANVYPFGGGTISFEASAGQLFSISNSLSGTIFSVNDVSGMPSISVNSSGVILLAPYGGKVGIGTSSSVGLTSNIFSLYGTAMVYGNIDLGNPTGGTSGIYFNDGTYLSSATAYSSYGNPGTIQIAGAGNTFNGDSSTFFWDNTNKRLGIGTPTPSNTLTVLGSTPGWFNTTNGANVIEVLVGNTTATSTTVGYAAAASTPYGYIAATASATKNITFNSLGYTGIGGVTLPKNTLDVGGGMVVGVTYAGSAIYTAPTNGLAVQGSVGVGTNGPASALDVNGWAGFRQGFSAAGAATVASLTSNGAVSGTTGSFSTSLSTTIADTATAASHYYVETASDNVIRPKTLANVRTEIVTTAAVNAAAATTVGTVTSGVWNAGAVTSSGAISGTVLTSTIATGTAPLTVASTTLVTNLNADLLDGLTVATGTNNVANQIVRTDANGYIQAGWINTTSGDNGTTAIDRVYASSDGYIRYYTPTNFRSVAGVPTNGNLGTTDLNTATISGMYRFDIPSANTPGFSYGQLLVMHGASDTITQIAGDYATSRLWTRSGNPTNVGGAGSWGAWRSLIDTVGGQTISGALTVSSTLTLGAGISFSLANPTLTASSYISLPGGLYVNGGTLYSQVVIQARGGINNDSAAALSITGGTSNITNVTGALNATGEVTAYSSDLRLKDDIRLIADPISKVLRLRGVIFDWKQSAVDHKVVQQLGSDVGVIAQEVQAVLPEAVKIAPFDRNDDGTSKSGENYLTVQYEKLTALLIEAVKDQQKMIDDLKNRVSNLESQLAK